MLSLRLSRIGKTKQPSFRLIVQEKTVSPKRKATEIVGFYNPAGKIKIFEIKEERVKHWLKVGAQPSDSVASLLKKKGFPNMDEYMEPRNKQRKSKKEATAPAA